MYSGNCIIPALRLTLLIGETPMCLEINSSACEPVHGNHAFHLTETFIMIQMFTWDFFHINLIHND